MEANALVEMYEISDQRYNICYNPFTEDKESSAYSTIDCENPYGPTVFLKKEKKCKSCNQCMDTNFHWLIKEYRGKNLKTKKNSIERGDLQFNK